MWSLPPPNTDALSLWVSTQARFLRKQGPFHSTEALGEAAARPTKAGTRSAGFRSRPRSGRETCQGSSGSRSPGWSGSSSGDAIIVISSSRRKLEEERLRSIAGDRGERERERSGGAYLLGEKRSLRGRQLGVLLRGEGTGGDSLPESDRELLPVLPETSDDHLACSACPFLFASFPRFLLVRGAGRKKSRLPPAVQTTACGVPSLGLALRRRNRTAGVRAALVCHTAPPTPRGARTCRAAHAPPPRPRLPRRACLPRRARLCHRRGLKKTRAGRRQHHRAHFSGLFSPLRRPRLRGADLHGLPRTPNPASSESHS